MHEFNKRSKAKELKPASEVVTVAVPHLGRAEGSRRCLPMRRA